MRTANQEPQFWWVSVAAGVIAVLFGLAALIWPSLTLGLLVLLFGAYVIVDGIIRLVAAFNAYRAYLPWWPQLLIGLIDIVVGVFLLTYPGLTSVLIVYTIAIWAILIGLVDVIRGISQSEFGRVAIGVLAILFGFVLLSNPSRGATAFVVVLAVFSIVRGITLLVDGLRRPAVPTAHS